MEDMIFIDSVRVIFTDCIGTCSLIKKSNVLTERSFGLRLQRKNLQSCNII